MSRSQPQPCRRRRGLSDSFAGSCAKWGGFIGPPCHGSPNGSLTHVDPSLSNSPRYEVASRSSFSNCRAQPFPKFHSFRIANIVRDVAVGTRVAPRPHISGRDRQQSTQHLLGAMRSATRRNWRGGRRSKFLETGDRGTARRDPLSSHLPRSVGYIIATNALTSSRQGQRSGTVELYMWS
jgi:hypothetical protein